MSQRDSQKATTAGKFVVYDWGLIVVIVTSLALAVLVYGYFLQHHRQLWTSLIHDRNAHYLNGLNFALDIRHGDLGQFIYHLHKARVWPPLHSVSEGIVLAVGGLDYRLAVLPSLAGWVGAAIFGFLTARRTVEQGGDWAGMVAAVFILASPAHRAFATDIMLESLGAGLTLLVLYLYLVVRQEEPSSTIGRWFALALTALFFEKYNYWLLCWVPMVLIALASHRQVWRSRLVESARNFPWRRWVIAQSRHPLNYLLAIILIVLAIAVFGGWQSIELAGYRISLRRPFNLVYLAYIVLLLRLWPWWWRRGREQVRNLPPVPRQLVYWHVWPVFLWLLWPHQLKYFFWFLSPENKGLNPQHNLFQGVLYYGNALINDYHVGWSCWLAVGLIGVSLLTWRQLRPGGVTLLCCVLLALMATANHPLRGSRFLHSWMAVGWVMAGAGFSHLIYSRLTVSYSRFRPWLAATGAGGLVMIHLPGLLQMGRAPEGGPSLQHASTLPLAGAYLPYVKDSRNVAFFSNMPIAPFVMWTVLEQRGRQINIETGLEDSELAVLDARRLENWLRNGRYDTVVFIDVPRDSVFYAPVPHADYRRVRELLDSQTVLPPIRRQHFPQNGCTVNIWQRIPR